MSDGNQSLQSKSYSKLASGRPTDKEIHSLDHPPIAEEDLVKLGVASQLIPFIVSTTLWAEQSPNASPPLSPAEAENLVETLDKVRPIRSSLHER